MTAAQIAREFARLQRMQRDLRLYELRYGDLCGVVFLLRRQIVEQMGRLAKLMRYGVSAAAVLMLCCVAALAQHDHAAGHAFYKSWHNKEGVNCCDNRDCGHLADADERTTEGKLEVRVEGTWCPIMSHHYLKSGNAPDWSTAHVCVRKSTAWHIIPVCDRLLCYQPKPSF